MIIRSIEKKDLPEATTIWNHVVSAANAFPGDQPLTDTEAWEMFSEQTAAVVAQENDRILGVYILHPNNIGRCSHIANASYAVSSDARGKGIGKTLVCDSIARCKQNGFLGLQFNAVVSSNTSAIALYLKLGFKILGTVANGYRLADGSYSDTLIFLKSWAPPQ